MTNIDPTSAPTNIAPTLDLVSAPVSVAPFLPALVLPSLLPIPVCPFEVASTAGSTVTVL